MLGLETKSMFALGCYFKLSLKWGICELGFGFKYVVTIMLFGLSLVQQEGSEDKA